MSTQDGGSNFGPRSLYSLGRAAVTILMEAEAGWGSRAGLDILEKRKIRGMYRQSGQIVVDLVVCIVMVILCVLLYFIWVDLVLCLF
jgi:hypothetical protein